MQIPYTITNTSDDRRADWVYADIGAHLSDTPDGFPSGSLDLHIGPSSSCADDGAFRATGDFDNGSIAANGTIRGVATEKFREDAVASGDPLFFVIQTPVSGNVTIDGQSRMTQFDPAIWDMPSYSGLS